MRTILAQFYYVSGTKSFSQAMIVDSLYRVYQNANVQDKILLLADIGYYYRLINPDSALKITQTALKMAKDAHFEQGEVNALGSIGSVYRIQGDMQNAMYYYFECLRIAEKLDLKVELAQAHLGIGVVYADLKEYDLAIQNINIAAQKYEKLNNRERYSTTLANLGEVYLKKKQLDSALIYLIEPHKYLMGIRSSAILPFSYSRLGRTYLMLKNYDLAYVNTMKAIEMGQIQNNVRVRCYSFQTLADYYLSLNKIDSAIYFAENAFKIANTHNFNWDVLESSNTLAKLYENQDVKTALYYSKLSKNLSDSLTGVDRVNALQRKIIQERENVRKKEAENLASLNTLKQNGLLIGLGILGFIGFILYRNNRQKLKANIQLHQQKVQIESTLNELKSTQNQLIQKEKLASLGELTAGIAHEIQNPLNFVNNFSELSVDLVKDLKEEIKRPDKDEAYIEELFDDLSQNQEKINHHGKRASSIVKGMLEHSRTSTGIKEPTDINKLVDESLRLSYHAMRAKDKSFNADFKMELDENLPKIEVIPQDMGRVLLNLINNAFYAVHQKNLRGFENLEGLKNDCTPSVVVTTFKKDNFIEVHVKDNGNGIPDNIKAKIFQPFFTTKPTGEGTGLGLSLSYDIVTKGHGGTLEVESSEGTGSTFILKLPILNNI